MNKLNNKLGKIKHDTATANKEEEAEVYKKALKNSNSAKKANSEEQAVTKANSKAQAVVNPEQNLTSKKDVKAAALISNLENKTAAKYIEVTQQSTIAPYNFLKKSRIINPLFLPLYQISLLPRSNNPITSL
jgi:hypothetical protein